MNILAIDYGKKRIGLAWSDTDVGVVLPYGVVTAGKMADKAQATLIEIIKNERIKKYSSVSR